MHMMLWIIHVELSAVVQYLYIASKQGVIL